MPESVTTMNTSNSNYWGCHCLNKKYLPERLKIVRLNTDKINNKKSDSNQKLKKCTVDQF